MTSSHFSCPEIQKEIVFKPSIIILFVGKWSGSWLEKAAYHRANTIFFNFNKYSEHEARVFSHQQMGFKHVNPI